MPSKCCSARIIVTKIGNGSYIEDPGDNFKEDRAMLMASIEAVFGHDWAKNEDFDVAFPEAHMYDRAIYGKPEMFANICEKCYSVEKLSTNIKNIRNSIDTMINELIEYNWQQIPYDEDPRLPWPEMDQIQRLMKTEGFSDLSESEFLEVLIKKFKFRPIRSKKKLFDTLQYFREKK